MKLARKRTRAGLLEACGGQADRSKTSCTTKTAGVQGAPRTKVGHGGSCGREGWRIRMSAPEASPNQPNGSQDTWKAPASYMDAGALY